MTTAQTTTGRTGQLLISTIYVLVAIVGVVALLVSSYYLHEYSLAAGMRDAMGGWLAWSLVVVLDVGGVAGTLVWVASTGKARAWGRGVALTNLGASVLGNILGHFLAGDPDLGGPWLNILTGAVYPAEVYAMVHLALLVRAELAPATQTQRSPRSRRPQGIPVGVTPDGNTAVMPIPDPIPVAVGKSPIRPARRGGVTSDLLEQVRQLRDERNRSGLTTGRRVLVAELGISDALGRKVLKELDDEPHLRPVSSIGGAR